MKPPDPVWQDEASGLTVWVNGGLIELTMAEGWSGRLLPSEVANLPEDLSDAINEAASWVDRWDIRTGSYREAEKTT